MRPKWTKEQAWEWYNSQPWIRGYNGFPSNAVNLIALWQSYNHEEIFAQQEREFALAKETGFNATRIQVNLAVWILEHDSFMKNLEEYLTLAAKYGQKVMLIFGGDSLTPKNKWEPPKLGEQKVDWGWHGGHKDGQFAYVHEGKGYSLLDEDEEYRENFFRMIDEISARYANDPRVQVWDIWNEIGGGGRGTARQVSPTWNALSRSSGKTTSPSPSPPGALVGTPLTAPIPRRRSVPWSFRT